MNRWKKKLTGFTLIELVITLTVIGILAAMAAPSFSNMIRSNQIITSANSLLASLQLARNEAAKQGVQVTVLSKSGEDHNWDNGLVIFTDWDQDQVFDDDGEEPVCDIEEDCVLLSINAYPNNLSLRTEDSYDSWVAYMPNGYPKASSGFGNGTFTLCDNALSKEYARSIVINTRGRAEVGEAEKACP